MLRVKLFTFNPFQENTYILFDETKECVIIDPGCYEPEEKKELFDFILAEELNPVKLLNTHCHIDHVLGNRFVFESYGLNPEIHKLEVPVLKSMANYGAMYGIHMEPSPDPLLTLTEGNEIKFGNSILKMLHTPGHSPGSICFYNEAKSILIGGDVLFRLSIGRSDLPGGDLDTLINSIRQKLWILPDEVMVYPGHGDKTTIGFEKKHNPFLIAYS
jgi:hydroxyacylglutathione hydrolase